MCVACHSIGGVGVGGGKICSLKLQYTKLCSFKLRDTVTRHTKSRIKILSGGDERRTD